MNNVKYNNKKILLVISSLRGGGAERVMCNMANYWGECGYDVILVTLDESMERDAYDIHKGIKRCVIFLKNGDNIISSLYWQWHRMLKLRELLIVERPDAVLSFMTHTNLLTILASRGTDIRCVVSERIHPLGVSHSKITDLLCRILYQLAYCVVVQTEDIMRWYMQNTRYRLTIIPNFINTVRVGSVEKNKTILAVGRLSRQKGFDVLIKAYAEIINNNPEWNLVILGEGPERKLLDELITNLKVKDNVKLVGRVENPIPWLREAAIYVQPSRFEGFPNALLEAMSQGLPVIASYDAGYMMIENRVNGIIVPTENIEKLRDSIQELILSPKLRYDLGEKAKNVNVDYGCEKIMRLWEGILFGEQLKIYK